MSTPTSPRRALVTGATGYVGGLLVPRLLQEGYAVRVLTRSPAGLAHDWVGQVEVAEGDATEPADLAAALRDVDVAYYLIHSMDGGADFRERDREIAESFGQEATKAGVGRIVYLSGLHPQGELSEHLASRVEVGQILLDSGVPTAVLQAATVIGAGSASFEMLRHLTTRLPVMVAPRWLDNRIQPVGVDDVLHWLVSAADLPPDQNRTFDIGGPDVLTYREMMQQFAEETGQRHRVIQTLPVLTPWLASQWVGLVTPVDAGVAKPLVGSLVHEVVCDEDDLESLVGAPEGGRTTYRQAVRRAMEGLEPDPARALPTWATTAGAVALSAALGGAVTNPSSRWYRSLDKPAWQPPGWLFPVVWTALYADIAAVSAATRTTLQSEEGSDRRQALAQADADEKALWLNLLLNTGWSATFFGAKRPGAATIEAAALAASSADLVRRAWAVDRRAGAALAPYAAWCGFATVLSAAIWRRNRR